MTKTQIENMRILGMTFLNLAESEPAECKVDMSEVYAEPVCETVACHAGWWAVAITKGTKFDRSLCYNYMGPIRFGFSYKYAAASMAQFLGFNDMDSLQNWARDNSNLWGNVHGCYMFLNPKAFKCTPETITLKKIGLHWLKVADRCEEVYAE